MFRTLILTLLGACLLSMGAAASAKTAKPHPSQHGRKMAPAGQKMVGYDAKDKRYYSIAWAKAHGMRDKGGDPLTIVPFATLPKEARESKAMQGAKI